VSKQCAKFITFLVTNKVPIPMIPTEETPDQLLKKLDEEYAITPF